MDASTFNCLMGDSLKSNLDVLNVVISGKHRLESKFRMGTSEERIRALFHTSIDIRFGNDCERVIDGYVAEITNSVPVNNVVYHNGKERHMDIVRRDDTAKKIYLIEQKVRDDHDKGKSDENINDFVYKINALRASFPGYTITAIMYFVDPAYKKHKGKYLNAMHNIDIQGVQAELKYGKELFDFFEAPGKWEEFECYIADYVDNYRRNKTEELRLSFEDIKSQPTQIYNVLDINNPEMVDAIKEMVLSEEVLLKMYEHCVNHKGKKYSRCASKIEELTIPK